MLFHRVVHGRADALARLTALVTGPGGALVLTGPPGIGRTALLAAAAAKAAGRVLRLAGVARERSLPGAGLDRLGADLGDLAGAVCLVDDAHLLDDSTVDVLLHHALRCAGRGTVFVFAGQEPLPGVDAVELSPVDDDAAERLLAEAVALPAEVRSAVVEIARGVPGHLLELARAIDPREPAVSAVLPVGGRYRLAIAQAYADLPPAARTAVLHAACGGHAQPSSTAVRAGLVTADGRAPSPAVAATVRAEAGPTACRTALTTLADTEPDPVRALCHRAAATPGSVSATALAAAAHTADPPTASRALRRAAALTSDPHLRSRWLLQAAAAAWAAGRPAQARADLSRLDTLLQSAAEPGQEYQQPTDPGHPEPAEPAHAHTPDRHQADPSPDGAAVPHPPGPHGPAPAPARPRPGKHHAPARADLPCVHSAASRPADAGHPNPAHPQPAAPLRRAPAATRLRSASRAGAELAGQAAVLRGEIELRDGDPAIAAHELGVAAGLLGDARNRAVALMLAGEARRMAGDVGGHAELARELAVLGSAEPLAAAHGAGLAATFAGNHTAARAPLRHALAVGARARDARRLIWAGEVALTLGQIDLAYECATAAVARARVDEPTVVPTALAHLALVALAADRVAVAVRAASEGRAAVGQRNVVAEHSVLLALAAVSLGDRATALERLAEAAPRIAERGLGRPAAYAAWARACVDLVDDRPDDALCRLRTMATGVGRAHPGIRALAVPQLVEAAVRCGEPEMAARALSRFDAWASSLRGPRWRALSHRCHALLGRSPVSHFERAIALHRQAGATLELARTHLLYAHHLRRDRQPTAARGHLREAQHLFHIHGATYWEDRVRTELRAATPSPAVGALTPQQAQIARLVADGETNREIARRLVLSPRTVDHHLRNIYTRLGIRSRTELARLVVSAGESRPRPDELIISTTHR